MNKSSVAAEVNVILEAGSELMSVGDGDKAKYTRDRAMHAN